MTLDRVGQLGGPVVAPNEPAVALDDTPSARLAALWLGPVGVAARNADGPEDGGLGLDLAYLRSTSLLSEPVQPCQAQDQLTTGSPFAEPGGVKDPPDALVAQVRVLIDKVERPEHHVRDGCLAGEESSLGTDEIEVLAEVSSGLETASQEALSEVRASSGGLVHQ